MTRAGRNAGGAAILTMWGASGSAPAAGPQRARWGGETVCLEIRAEDAPPEAPSLFIDMGSGAREAGRALMKRSEAAGVPARCTVLLSHLHLDHVMGAPFFGPFYKTDAEVDIRCGLYEDVAEFETMLKTLVSPPFFPIQPLTFGAARFAAFRPGETFEAAGFAITARRLHHPGGCMGFRVEGAGWALAVLGDHEHGEPEADAGALALARDADLAIYDAAYTEAEYPAHEGWGHSTWEKGLDLAEAAGARKVLMHHHLPERTDDDLDALSAQIEGASGAATLARQGMRWRLSADGAELLEE